MYMEDDEKIGCKIFVILFILVFIMFCCYLSSSYKSSTSYQESHVGRLIPIDPEPSKSAMGSDSELSKSAMSSPVMASYLETQVFDSMFTIFRKAAERGSAEAQVIMGLCYKNGKGVDKDLEEAAKWFAKSANQGNVNGQYYLGVCYDHGWGVEQDKEQAVRWYTKAAEQGDPDSQHNLAVSYEDGEGVERNINEAIKWYTKAAEQGYDLSLNNLGNIYMSKGEYEKAVEYFKKAAEIGCVQSQVNIGICYEEGKGVERDDRQALWWYARAARNGSNTGYRYYIDLLKLKYPDEYNALVKKNLKK